MKTPAQGIYSIWSSRKSAIAIPLVAIVVIALGVLPRVNPLFRGVSGLFVFVAGILHPPAAPALLLSVQYAPSVVFPGTSSVPMSEHLFIAIMLINIAVRFVSQNAKSPKELYIPKKIVFALISLMIIMIMASAFGKCVEQQLFSLLKAYVFCILSMCMFTSEEDRKTMVLGIILTSLVLAVGFLVRGGVAEVQTIGDFERTDANMMDPNYLGCGIGVGLICCVSFLMSGKLYEMLPHKLVTIAVSGILFVGLMLQASRGMAIAIAITLIVMGAVRYRKIWQMILLLLIAAAALPPLYNTSLFEPLRRRFEEKSLSDLSGRVDIFNDAYDMLKKSDAVELMFGHGVSSFYLEHGIGCHNAYVEYAIEEGICGLLLLLFIFSCVLFHAIRKRDFWGTCSFGLMTFLMLAGLSINVFNYFYFVYPILGLLIVQNVPESRKSAVADATGG